MADITLPVPINIAIGLAVSFCVLLIVLLRNLMRRQPTGFVATCTVVLGIFLAYQFVSWFSVRYGQAQQQDRQVAVANPQVRVWADMQTGLYRCAEDQSWGRSRKGKYMTQSEAVQDAFRPAHNQPCQ